MALFIIGSLPITNSVSAEDEVDNWPENDAWLHIELISWSANETVEWDNNGGLPDPIFKICIEADGDNLDCINTPTWENQLTLNNSWNYSMDIPDNSNILNITIECEDNDAFNDDECDMNSDVNYWRLYAEYNWSATPSLTISGDGDDDDDDTWKNAASIWKFSIDGYGDEDGDGVSDNIDTCPSTDNLVGFGNVNQSEFLGCSWSQVDIDQDGVINELDADPFDARIGIVSGGSRTITTSLENGRIPMHVDCSGTVAEHVIWQLQGEFCLAGNTNYDAEYQNYPGYTINPSMDGVNTKKFWQPSVYHGYNTEMELPPQCQGSQNSKFFAIGQNKGGNQTLIHCVTSEANDPYCNTTVFSFDVNYSLTELFSISDQAPLCDYQLNSKGSARSAHIGAFGDFDSNGALDLAYADGIYYGISQNSLDFHFLPIELDYIGAMNAIDFDNDGFDDIVGSRGIVFMDDNGVLSRVNYSTINEQLLGTQIFDFDSDGDLDLLVFTTYDFTDHRRAIVSILYNQWFPDNDSDGVSDLIDICPESVGIEVDQNGCSPSQLDSDNDTIADDFDLCPATGEALIVDQNGCAEQQLDEDNDGINNAIDECPETPEGDLVNVRGCSFEDSQDLDSDNDGVLDSVDACPNTLAGITVDSIGCDLDGNQTPDTDSDGDKIYDSLDDCANTPSGATVDFTGCPMDSDFDGVYDGIDECPSSNNPSPSDMDKSTEVDSTGCFIDAARSESNSGSAASGCLGMIVMIGVIVFVVRKIRSPKQEQVFYAQTQPVISPVHRQSVPTPQVSSRERQLEHQSRQAQIETQRLRQQLANQAQITQQLQSEAAQKQMSEAALAQKQNELAVAQREKEELEAKLAEAEKNTHIVQNITYNIQDSAISGDITNKINRNDLE